MEFTSPKVLNMAIYVVLVLLKCSMTAIDHLNELAKKAYKLTPNVLAYFKEL